MTDANDSTQASPAAPASPPPVDPAERRDRAVRDAETRLDQTLADAERRRDREVDAAEEELDRAAAEVELRRVAAEWICTVRTLLTTLTREFEAVNHAAKEGSLLARVIDAEAVNSIYIELYNADCHACSLSTVGHELPTPDLLGAAAAAARAMKKGGA